MVYARIQKRVPFQQEGKTELKRRKLQQHVNRLAVLHSGLNTDSEISRVHTYFCST
jgi:hypothetical protein